MSKDKDSGMNPEDFLLHSKEISDATIPKKHCAVTRDILLYLNELSVDIGYNMWHMFVSKKFQATAQLMEKVRFIYF